jgi:hypothetical protein
MEKIRVFPGNMNSLRVMENSSYRRSSHRSSTVIKKAENYDALIAFGSYIFRFLVGRSHSCLEHQNKVKQNFLRDKQLVQYGTLLTDVNRNSYIIRKPVFYTKVALKKSRQRNRTRCVIVINTYR